MTLLAHRYVVLRHVFSRRAFIASAAVSAAGLAASPAFAADAAQLIQSVSTEVIDLVKTKPAGPEREAGIRKVLETSFDLPFMGRSALALYWDETNEQQRARFLKAAISAEAKAYSERFGQYGGQTLTIGKVVQRSGGVQVVESKLNQSNGQPIKIDWEVRNDRITDVKIEGVSMVATRRSDYKSYISNHGNRVEPLIEELEQRAKSR